MPTIDPELRLQVAVGVLGNCRGQYLVQQRPKGKPCPGQWEFPGGKIEPGEIPRNALARELLEELGVTVLDAAALATIYHDYDHARVKLEVFSVTRFEGCPRGLEGQQTRWCNLTEIQQLDVLEAVYPIINELILFNSQPG